MNTTAVSFKGIPRADSVHHVLVQTAM